jgi:serpin B
MKPSFLTSLALTGALLGGLSAHGQNAQGPNALSADAAKLAQDSNAFALSLYGQLDDREGNLFFSPYSVSTALGMTYAGARGATAEQMAKTLHYRLEGPQLHAAFAELIGQQNAAGQKRGYELSVANALWGQQGFGFQPDVRELMRKHYGAGLREVDFMDKPDAARREINAWVEKQTNGKIKDLLKEGTIQPDMRLVLASAIYFKSAWLNPFSQDATKKGDFFTGGKKVAADMMQRTGTYSFYEDEDVQVLDLPYARRDLSLVAVLPRDKAGLGGVEKNLSAAKLEGWLKAKKDYQVDVKLPKFKMTQELDLKKALSDLGMPLAFENAADFSGFSTLERLKIGFVVHKAFIDLNEKGTEAAAATAVGIVTTSLPVVPPNRAVFHADHPFLFVIRDNRTGSILFMGRVVDPA